MKTMKSGKWMVMPLVLGVMLMARAATAAIGSEVMVEGEVGDFNDKSVELTVQGGTKIRVSRSAVRSKEEALRPGSIVIAIADMSEILVIPRKKAK
jgi:hypothetical protein